MNMHIQFLCVAGLLGTVSLMGVVIQTPLPFESYFRNQLYTLAKYSDEHCWHIDALFGGYSRSADTAFGARCDHCSHNQGALTTLFFNEPCFTAAQVFAPSSPPSPNNPFLNTLLCPRLRYTDSGVVMMVSADYHVDRHWDIGIRAQLPVRKIKVKRLQSPGTGSSIFGGESIVDVARFDTETVDGVSVDSFAFRLDFLSKIAVDCQQPGLSIPFVNYRNSAFPITPITMFNLDVTDNPALDNLPLGPDNRNAVTILQSNGIPPEPFGVAQSAVQGLPALSGDGTSLTPGGRARFVATNNYTALGANQTLESQMWVVPTVDVPNDALVSRAQIIDTQVQRLLTCIASSAEDFFTQCAGTSFDCQEQTGFGDLDSDLFARYNWCDAFLTEGFVGVRFPTGKKTEFNKVFLLPLGNNGHTEIKIGAHIRWQPCDWFIFNADALFARALPHTERVAATFRGALIKSLGLPACAKISWSYVEAHLDATGYIWRSECFESSLHLGYELYRKWKDHVCFNTQSATDCLGSVQLLDASVLADNTQGLSHKVYGDLCVGCYPTSWAALRLFGGFNVIVAGQSVPKEHGFQVGTQVYIDF
jgi:hypothetical protein